MKIGVDARFYGITGIGRYVKNLITELEKLDPPKADKSKNEYVIFLWKKTFDAYQPQNPNFTKVLADYPLYSFKEQLLFPPLIYRQGLDLMHFTNFNVPLWYWGRYVLTVHDLIHMQHSTFGSTTRNYYYYLIKRLVYNAAIRWGAWRAQRVIVPSKDAKRDVEKLLRVRPERIVVTYEGLDEKLKVQNEKLKNEIKNSKLILEKYNIRQPYLLYVATMYPHKNHKRLIQAYEGLISSFNPQPATRNPQLVLVGKVDYFSKQLKEFVEQKGLSDKIIFPNFQTPDGYLPDEDLAVFYANAAAYVFPSLKEGFGIPILEAWNFGVPVIASNTSSLPEVGGDAVLYFDPYNVEDIVGKIGLVLSDETLRQRLIEKGFKRQNQFSWRKMAGQTMEVYRHA